MRKGVIGLSLVLSLSLIPAYSATPPKAGFTCAKLGKTQSYQGKLFTCIKSGKKLIWNKGVLERKTNPAPSPSPSPTMAQTSSPTIAPTPESLDKYQEPSRPSRNLQECSISEIGSQRAAFSNFSLKSISGFPMTHSRLSSNGKINFLAIPIDWADFPGDVSLLREVKTQLEIHDEWWNVVSEGKLKLNSTLFDKWIRLPGDSKSYAVPFSEAYPETGLFWSKVIKVIDPYIDFSDVQVITFIFPRGQTVIPASVQELFPIGSIKDNPPQEGNITAFIGPGWMFYQWNTNPWSYWAHETGHLLDFAHGGSPNGNEPMGGYDIMFSQDGPLRTLSGWWRFLAGWLEDNQVYCQSIEDFAETKFYLSPINSSQEGIKLVALKLSSSKVLLIESRRFSKFDNTNRTGLYQQLRESSDWNGVLAYLYDANKGHLQDFFTPFASNTALSEYNWDGQTRFISKKGEVIEAEGLRIQITDSGKYDKVTVSKLTAEDISKPRPTPSPAPSPTTDDFNVVPFAGGGGVRTGESIGVSTWHGQNYRSYRIYVVPASDPSAAPLFDTGIVNDYRSPIKVNLSNLTCKRDELEVAIFYSGLNGKGLSTRIEQSHLLSKVTIDPRTGKCLGNWSITPRS